MTITVLNLEVIVEALRERGQSARSFSSTFKECAVNEIEVNVSAVPDRYLLG